MFKEIIIYLQKMFMFLTYDRMTTTEELDIC